MAETKSVIYPFIFYFSTLLWCLHVFLVHINCWKNGRLPPPRSDSHMTAVIIILEIPCFTHPLIFATSRCRTIENQHFSGFESHLSDFFFITVLWYANTLSITKVSSSKASRIFYIAGMGGPICRRMGSKWPHSYTYTLIIYFLTPLKITFCTHTPPYSLPPLLTHITHKNECVLWLILYWEICTNSVPNDLAIWKYEITYKTFFFW